MLKCTYIVLIYNNENSIPNLIKSLKQINGDFRREFIFVDDGSTDNSLNTLKLAVNDLPRTTIITQENQGPSASINKAANLATGDYIHFVEGDEVLHPESTDFLIKSSLKLGTQVSVGCVSNKLNEENISTSAKLIETPIKHILTNKIPALQQIGKSGSLIYRELLEKIGKADGSIYTQNMSLSLRCAKYSKFAYIDANISHSSYNKEDSQNKNFVSYNKEDSQNKNFVSYNNLKAIYNFTRNNPDLFNNLTSELLSCLSHETSNNSSKLNYSFKSIANKYIKLTSLNKILELYKKELNRLF